MRTDKIKSIAKKISKKYGFENFVIVEKLEKNKIEIRTELTSYEGGFELVEAIAKVYPDVIVENQGGCIYIAYIPE